MRFAIQIANHARLPAYPRHVDLLLHHHYITIIIIIIIYLFLFFGYLDVKCPIVKNIKLKASGVIILLGCSRQ